MTRRTIFLLPLVLAVGCGETGTQRSPFCPGEEDLSVHVDPMVGTRGSGNAVPAAMVPHGMVRAGPDTDHDPLEPDAYEHGAARIEGFTHTHLQGPGGSGNGYSHILLMPTTGALVTEEDGYASAFSHDTEDAAPGYYAVTLHDTGIRVELTASGRAALHRYTFPEASDARVLIDLGHSLGDSRGGQVTVVDDRTVVGHGEYMVHLWIDLLLNTGEEITGRSRVYFHARFSKPFDSFGTWKGREDEAVVRQGAQSESGAWIGAFLGFTTGASEIVEVRLGLSLISEEQARLNLEEELEEKTFEEVREEARAAWNCLLNRVRVEGGGGIETAKFYTALYHTLMAPADYTESGGRFFTAADMRGRVFQRDDRRFYTDDWCAWDTFRTSRPLATLVEPETVDDVVASYLHLYEQGGWLPKCTWHASGYSRVMIGNHAVAIVADAITKGFDRFDLETAWAAVHKSATDDNLFIDSLCGYPNLGTPAEYIQEGYVSHECDLHQSASMTLEYAYNDWCIARMAETLGMPGEAAAFDLRAQSFRNHFNPEAGFMQGRRRDGSWVEPFDPANSEDANDFCEATSWIYTWFVPHDVPGLISLMGGQAPFAERLDRFFEDGHFEISNEPSFHVPFLYNHAGAAAKAQARVRRVMEEDFSHDPDGLPGNDDAGATSAWYVFAAMGLYPLAPGDGLYEVVSPGFDRVTLFLHPDFHAGETFVVEAPGASSGEVYIQSATLNGEVLEKPRIRHEDVVKGGVLRLELGDEPSVWGE